MSSSTNLGADDLIVEPIAEAVVMYDNLLEELRKFMVSDKERTGPHKIEDRSKSLPRPS